MAKTIKTTIHAYRFDMDNPEHKSEYAALCARLQGAGYHWFNVLASPREKRIPLKGGESREIELETECLFDNQWNTAPWEEGGTGWRVFDWYEGIYPNERIKDGHWLEMTEEMRAVRARTYKCGYCGAHYPEWTRERDGAFCFRCLDSAYLKESDLKLLRLAPIVRDSGFAELTEEERRYLVPAYQDAQLHGNQKRAEERRARERADIEENYQKSTERARERRDGLLWLWERGIRLDTVLYYDHTRTFGFGWQKPVDAAMKARLLDLLCEFPFAYSIECEDEEKVKTGGAR